MFEDQEPEGRVLGGAPLLNPPGEDFPDPESWVSRKPISSVHPSLWSSCEVQKSSDLMRIGEARLLRTNINYSSVDVGTVCPKQQSVKWFCAVSIVQFGVNSCRSAVWIQKVRNGKRTEIEALSVTACQGMLARGKRKTYFFLATSKKCDVPVGLAYEFTDRHHRGISAQLLQIGT